MARNKDVVWDIKSVSSGHISWEQVSVCVLMDLRDELKAINRRLNCVDTLAIPRILKDIRRNTTKRKRIKK